MKPILRKIDTGADYSFSIREDIHPYLYNHWHYHPEIELTFIRKGKGIRLVGDSMQPFEDGDLVLLGTNIPHLWRSDASYFEQSSGLTIEAIAIHFKSDFWGDTFLALPEMAPIKRLMENAQRGIKLLGSTHSLITNRMEGIIHAQGAARIEQLLHILNLIASSQEIELLSSAGFVHTFNANNTDRIDQIFNYTFTHFKEPLSIEQVASAVNLSPHSFCRYFKTRTLKTYWQFLLEIRIGYACRLLIADRHNISQVAFESGFSNLSNFNRQFRSIMQMTPQQYVKTYRTTPQL
ncbi:AraC family transcriptional regulator [Parapedobacter koreensis]|uniref:Transcriptional regulator, AraC family n=1 Tax=Parapedobacter koreensis TaxID=332977 RepID=A0A1H7THG4_9SPHI|nr:AraC family transcriptional regulator [Parapedobacter koreensis]SEL84300.1 transcriptional regulator, AraC family [Parapedobacter koreensis]